MTLIAITALLGLGALTVLGVQTELAGAGQSRASQMALYAAESGANAGIDFLRSNCSTESMFTAFISANNADPPSPTAVAGNHVLPNGAGNPFAAAQDMWYEVSFYNNKSDPGFVAGTDTDGTVILHAIGHGPDNSVATVDVEIQNMTCLTAFCEQEYAQRNVTSRNDANAACSSRVTNSNFRQLSTQ